MAVEIPVYIDIDGAFEDAAKRVRQDMKQLQDAVEKNAVKIRVDNTSIKDFNAELEALNEWYRELESAEWSKIGQKLDLGPTINRAILELQRLEKEINTIQELRWSEGGGGDFSFAEEYHRLRNEVEKTIGHILALEQTQAKMAAATGANTREHIEGLSRTSIEVLQLQGYYDRLEKASEKWSMETSRGIEAYAEGMSRVSIELLRMREYYQELEASSMRLSDSVNGYQARISELNQKWNSMTRAERESEEGRKVYQEYMKEADALENEIKTLGELRQREKDRVAEAKKAAEERVKAAKKEAEERRKAAEKAAEAERKEQERIDQLRKKGIQSRRYENAILNSTVKTMRVLQEQERILSDRLSRAAIGSGKYEAVRKQLEGVRREMEKAKGAADNYTVSMAQQQNVLGKLTSQFTAYISIFSLIRFAKQIRDVTGELEYQRVALGHLIQDEEYGAALFEKIKQEAVKSPFRIKELVTYTKQLAAYRIEQENLFGTMTRLADISAGLGVDMNRLILAYGQVRAASVLRGQELRQFTEAGIPLVEMLTEKMGELNNRTYETADIFKLISARAVPFSAIADIFEELTDKGGMFYKMQETQAKTLQGRWEKLKDTFDIALQSIGESKGLFSFKTYNDILLGSLELLAKNLRLVPKLIEGASLAWGVYYLATTKARIATRKAAMAEIEEATAKQAQTIANIRGIKHVDAYTAAMVRQKVATNALSKAFWKLYAAIIANPWGAALAAIAGIAMAIFSFRKKTEDATSKLSEFKTAVEDLANAEKAFEKTEKLIDKYKELAEKTDRTEEESRKLDETMGKLQDRFPGMTALIDGETKSLEDNVAALRKKNEEQVAASRDEARARLDAARSNKNALQKILDEQVKKRDEAYHEMQLAEQRMRKRDTGELSREQAPYKLAEGEYKKALNMFNEIDAQVDETRAKISGLDNSIVALDKYLNKTSAGAKMIEAWKEQLGKLNDYETSLGKMQLFTPQEIDDLEGVYDFFKKLKKVWTDAKESASGLKSAYENATDAATKAKLLEEYKDALARFNAAEFERSFFGFNFKSTTESYQQDPFIAMTRNRIKFMQDFKKGYEDLNKYMSSHDALAEQAKNMSARGISLDLSPDEQQRAAQELSKWYQDEMDRAWQKAKAHGATGKNIEEFLQQQIKDTSNRGKALRDFQSLLQSLFDAKTDFDTTQMTKNLENAMKRVKEEISHSETARNFFNDILEQTGDQELATNLTVSVYGDIGSNLKANIVKELNKALETIKPGDVSEALLDAVRAGDIKTVAKYMDLFPKEWQARLQEMLKNDEKYNADRIKNLYKTYEKTKTYAERITAIEKREAEERRKIEEDTALSPAQKQQLIAASLEKQGREIAEVQVEALKNTYEWTQAFEDLDRIGNETLENLRKKILALIEANKGSLTPEQLKALRQELQKIYETQAQRDPLGAIVSGGQRAITIKKAMNLAINKQEFAEAKRIIEEYNKTVDDTKKIDISHLEDEFYKANNELEKGINGVNEYVSAWKSAIDAIQDAFDLDEVPVIGEALEGISSSLSFVAGILPAIISLNQILNATLMSNPFVAAGAAIVGTIGAIVGAIKGVINANVRRANREIERQQELIDTLEKSYKALDKAMDEAFGNDYMSNYAQQLQVINAEIEAYRAQAAAERSKGKKKDEEKIKEYEQNVVDAMERIEEAGKDLQAFFAGTDLASASQDFASAWLDAYQEFGDTAGAIEERMEEMVKNLVEKAALSGIVESILGPWFKSLEGVKEWDAATIASKMSEARGLAETLNNALLVQVSDLQSAGAQLRGTVGQFTGIKRDIANASEESISGLAAGVNTQNFFLQHIDANVMAIVAALTGESEASAARRSAAAAATGNEDQALVYSTYIPEMHDDLRAIRLALDRVVKLNGDRHAVNVRM